MVIVPPSSASPPWPLDVLRQLHQGDVRRNFCVVLGLSEMCAHFRSFVDVCKIPSFLLNSWASLEYFLSLVCKICRNTHMYFGWKWNCFTWKLWLTLQQNLQLFHKNVVPTLSSMPSFFIPLMLWDQIFGAVPFWNITDTRKVFPFHKIKTDLSVLPSFISTRLQYSHNSLVTPGSPVEPQRFYIQIIPWTPFRSRSTILFQHPENAALPLRNMFLIAQFEHL